MAILWPAAIGKPLEHVLFRKGDPLSPKRYVQNAGPDYSKDGEHKGRGRDENTSAS